MVKALARMKIGMAMGLNGTLIEAWKYLGETECVWLTRLFNKILRMKKMLDKWKRSVVVPIDKNKRDI